MSLVNSTNNQFIQPLINNRKGVVCNGQSGGGFGSTNNSLTHSANNSLGKGYPAPIKYTNCNKQSGGAHNYDNDFPGQIYGFSKVGADMAQQFKGSYAPITVTPKTNMCGGKKRRRKTKKRKRRRKNKSRKSRKRRRTKRRRTKRRKRAGTYSKSAKNLLSKNESKYDARINRQENDAAGLGATAPRSGLGGTGGRRRRRTRRKRGSGAPPVPPRHGTGRKKRTQRRKRKQGGGSYSQYGSNIPITPSYSSPNPSSMPWATGPGSISRQMNCRDNYNHYKN